MIGPKWLAGLAVALLAATAAQPAWAQAAIQLRGSDSLAPLAEKVAEAYMAEHPGSGISIISNTTGRGLKALLDGTADGALASSDISGQARRRADAAGVTLKAWVVAHDAIQVVVNAGNPVADLSIAQLRAIYTGAVSDWSEVGGAPGPIHIFAVEPASGTAGTWRQLVIGPLALQTPRATIVETDEVARRIAGDPHAIGYVAGHMPGTLAKAITVDGVPATPANLRNGSYPLARALSVVTLDPPPPELAAFLDWFCARGKGQRLVAASGAAPLEEETPR